MKKNNCNNLGDYIKEERLSINNIDEFAKAYGMFADYITSKDITEEIIEVESLIL